MKKITQHYLIFIHFSQSNPSLLTELSSENIKKTIWSDFASILKYSVYTSQQETSRLTERKGLTRTELALSSVFLWYTLFKCILVLVLVFAIINVPKIKKKKIVCQKKNRLGIKLTLLLKVCSRGSRARDRYLAMFPAIYLGECAPSCRAGLLFW